MKADAMPFEIYNTDYNSFIHILGTAHFTRRSLDEAQHAVRETGTRDLAIELDPRRFSLLNGYCHRCPIRGACKAKCEFIGACDALGNVEANIWLIDMSQEEIHKRIRSLTNPWAFHKGLLTLEEIRDEKMPWLWERGWKEEVNQRSREGLELLRRAAPTVWRVLIEERNILMAARLAWIASKRMDKGEKLNVLALVGAAHVEGIQNLLRNPVSIRDGLRSLSLPYSPPFLVKRVGVGGDLPVLN